MKRLIGFLAFTGVFILAGCFDTAEEITINEDGSGTLVNSVDMSKMITALSAMGADEKMKDAEKINTDTTIFLKSLKDSIQNLSDNEKKLLEKGKAHLIMNMKEEKFSVTLSVPFASTIEIPAVKDVLKKSNSQIMEKLITKIMPVEANN